MATLADELLNDFDDSGDEQDEENNGFHSGEDNDGQETGLNAAESMEVDANEDEEAEEESDARKADDDLEGEEEAKAKVEKMQLGGVSDVRNVAGLMKQLQPVLEVSYSNPES